MTVLVYPDPETLAKVTAARLCLDLADAAAVREDVHLAIAGGSVGTSVLGAVPDSELAGAVNWGNVHVWWVDERFVPIGHADRNDAAVTPVFAKLGIPEENIHSMPSPAQAHDVADGAAQYAATLADHAPEGGVMPLFDVVLLGMGPDGHIASLFPQPLRRAVGRRVRRHRLAQSPRRTNQSLPRRGQSHPEDVARRMGRREGTRDRRGSCRQACQRDTGRRCPRAGGDAVAHRPRRVGGPVKARWGGSAAPARTQR